jgi:hypothetical protein
MVLGLNAANSTYSCVWCHVHKDARSVCIHIIYGNTALNESMHLYITWRWDTAQQNKPRTLEEVCQCAMLPPKAPLSKKLGVKATPLIRIMLDHVTPDELHLMLYIFDVNMRNIVVHATDWDKKQNIRQPCYHQRYHSPRNWESKPTLSSGSCWTTSHLMSYTSCCISLMSTCATLLYMQPHA